jgi:predicted Zn-dependent peptidase
VIAHALALVILLASSAHGVDRSKPPKPGPPRPLTLPRIQRLALQSGVPVLLVEQHEVPTVSIALVVRSGAAADPEDRPGLANMTAAMLDEGAGSRDALALSDALDGLGADVSASAGWDSSTVSLHVPVRQLAEALPLMADVALRPTFPEAELRRQRMRSLTSLLQLRDSPSGLAGAAVARAVFGRHPYGRLSSGDAAALQAMTTDDLRRFHGRHYRRQNATLIVVGDVTPEVLPRLDQAFSDWPGAEAEDTPVPAPPPTRGRTIWLIDRPKAPQSTVRVGCVGPPRTTSEYHALEVMNAVLGGMSSARLNANLRETRQYTYGAYSGFSYRRAAGLFTVRTDVQTPSTADAVKEALDELARIRATPEKDELERARAYLAFRHPSDFETPGQIAGALAALFVYGLPEDTFAKYVPSVMAVKTADAKRVAARHVRPDDVAIVVVGDRSVIEEPLRRAGLGEVKIATVEDILGPAPQLEALTAALPATTASPPARARRPASRSRGESAGRPPHARGSSAP